MNQMEFNSENHTEAFVRYSNLFIGYIPYEINEKTKQKTEGNYIYFKNWDDTEDELLSVWKMVQFMTDKEIEYINEMRIAENLRCNGRYKILSLIPSRKSIKEKLYKNKTAGAVNILQLIATFEMTYLNKSLKYTEMEVG